MEVFDEEKPVKLLTPATLAAKTGLLVSAARELMRSEEFPSFKFGSRYYVHPVSADEFFKKKRILERETH